MTRYLKSALLVGAGLVWIAFAVVLGFVLLHFLAHPGPAAPAVATLLGSMHLSVGLAVADTIGFLVATFLSFAIGVVLCAYGLVPPTAAR